MIEHGLAHPAPPERVVVIGAGGFIGGAIADRLERAGAPVVRMARRDIDLLAPGAEDALAQWLRPDDAVVVAAAIAPCRTPEELEDNVRLATAVARSLKRTPVAHVVNIGSDAVFADVPTPLTETSPRAPGSLHGVMHLAREILFETEVRAPLVTLRPTLVYGARDPHDGYGPNRFRRAANRGEDIALFGGGEELRDHVAVEDVAELATQVVLHRSRGALNIASGTVVCFRELAEQVIALAVAAGRKPVGIARLPRTGPMPHGGFRPFDIAAIAAAFPDFHPTPPDQGMAQAQREEFPDARGRSVELPSQDPA